MTPDELRAAGADLGLNLYGIGEDTLASAIALVGNDDVLLDALQMDPLPQWLADLLVVPRTGYLRLDEPPR